MSDRCVVAHRQSFFPPGIRAAVAIFSLLGALAAGLEAQEGEAQAARARKYLEQLGASWSLELPADQVLGIYFGRKWVGQAAASVRPAAGPDGAAFEVTWNAESKLSGKWMCTRERVRLTRKLELVAAQSFEEGPFGKVTSTLTTQDARWRLRREQKGTATYQDGPLRPGTTWNASFLPLFRRPEDPSVTLLALDGDQSPVVLGRPPSPEGSAAGAEEEPGGTFEVRRGAGSPGVWRFGADGRVLEFKPVGAFVRFRPASAEQAGKDLPEPPVASEPLKALAEVFRAVKRGDRLTVASALDFESLARELVPGYGSLEAPAQRQLIDQLKSKTPGELIAPKFRDSLPEESLIEDYFAAASSVTEKDGTAEVRLLETGLVWKLSRVAEGRWKGRWLVTGIR